MEKYLKVIKPFFLLDEDHEFTTDDVFEKNADGNHECTTTYVNIFDEIDKLRDSYTNNLKTIDDRHKDDPACLKTEDEAVTTNLIKLLDYLKSLKK